MNKKKFKALLEDAENEGRNDTYIDDMVSDGASDYVDSLNEKLTDDERTELVNAYCDGFMLAGLTHKQQVVIEVVGGVAHVKSQTEGIEVIINDLDN